MPLQFSRTEMLIGKEALEKLKGSSVAVFGVGGVGSFAVEALARCGVGSIAVFDKDKVDITNLNRQLIATHKTIGRLKVDVVKERILDINPEVKVSANAVFYTKENADKFDLSGYNYIIDAIDTITSKIELVARAKEKNIPIISSMGAGNKLDPTRFEVADIYETSVCPLAKVMRKLLKKRGIKDLKVVYSKEQPVALQHSPTILPDAEDSSGGAKRHFPGSISFVPPVAGLIIAGEVIKDLIK